MMPPNNKSTSKRIAVNGGELQPNRWVGFGVVEVSDDAGGFGAAGGGFFECCEGAA